VIRQVVFDLDGTLVDSYRDIASGVNDVLHALGRERRDPQEIKTMIGEGVVVLLERALAPEPRSIRGADRALVDEARKLFKDLYKARLLETTRPYEGVLEAIAELARNGVVCSIATNKPSLFTNPIVAAFGFERAGIRGVASADEARARKPDPSVIELAIQRTGQAIDKSATIYVGDMPIDQQAARTFGCAMAGVGWGFDPEPLRRLDPDRWIENPKELASVLLGSAQ